MTNNFQIKIEYSLNSPLKSNQRTALLNDISEFIEENDVKINSKNGLLFNNLNLNEDKMPSGA